MTNRRKHHGKYGAVRTRDIFTEGFLNNSRVSRQLKCRSSTVEKAMFFQGGVSTVWYDIGAEVETFLLCYISHS